MADLISDSGDLAGLLRQTIEAHHDAFIETGGADPEWPIWYAAYLHQRLPALRGVALTQSEWVFLLVKVEQSRLRQQIKEPWYDYYARVFLEETSQGNPLSPEPTQ